VIAKLNKGFRFELSFGRKQPLSEHPHVLFERVGPVLCYVWGDIDDNFLF
jgi:hypothetical protein